MYGTWCKRGFTSLVAVVAVMKILSGEVIDTEVMAKNAGPAVSTS